MTIRRVKWLDDTVCNHIGDFYGFGEFEDGSVSGPSDRNIKRNTQMVDADSACSKLFAEQFQRHPFTMAISARHFTVPLFLRYTAENQDHYSFHNDAPIMGDLRSDLLFITAINDESEYEGGDLIIRVGSENIVFRLKKGEGLLMDPTYWHTVTPVTKGERRVAVVWVEHLIQNSFIRELYYEFIDLSHKALNSIDDERWNQLSDINKDTLFSGFRYRILREYGSAYDASKLNNPALNTKPNTPFPNHHEPDIENE
jgi:PKHD-type hydroxylase